MRKQSLLGVFVLGLVLFFGGASAHAQDLGKISVFGGYSYLSNGGTPCDCEFDQTTVGLHGYNGAVTYNFNRHVGFEANFAGNNGSPTVFSEAATTENGFTEKARQDVYSYTFGPKLTETVGHFSLFTHFLVGGSHIHDGFTETCLLGSESEGCGGDTFSGNVHGNGFAFKTGGGVDWNHGRWGLRLLEVDYERTTAKVTEHEDGDEEGAETLSLSSNSMSLSAGITFNFGK